MPAAGLLLRDDLHHRYDRLEWSFYYTVSDESIRAAAERRKTPTSSTFSYSVAPLRKRYMGW